MKTHNIPLESFTANGKISLSISSGELYLASKRIIDKNAGYASIPFIFKLPFRIDMTLKANSSDFRLKTGKGGVHFSAPINHSGGGIRRGDILTGKEESAKHDYDNDLPLDEYVNLSVVYGGKMTWVEINGKHCYSTAKAPYLSEKFTDGLNVGIGCGKNVEVIIKSFTVTEYENDEPDIPAEIANLPELSPFDWYIKSLPHEVRNEVTKTDEYLLKDMKNSLKFKRSIDKYGYVTYISPCGFQYKMYKFITDSNQENNEQHDAFGKHRTSWMKSAKPNHTVEILNKLAESSPEFADKMFSKLKLCGNAKCSANSMITYKGKSERTCGSSIVFEWLPSEFTDVRRVVAIASEVVKAVDESK